MQAQGETCLRGGCSWGLGVDASVCGEDSGIACGGVPRKVPPAAGRRRSEVAAERVWERLGGGLRSGARAGRPARVAAGAVARRSSQDLREGKATAFGNCLIRGEVLGVRREEIGGLG